MKYNNILGAIGNTPVIRLAKLFPNNQVWIKLEKSNPGGSRLYTKDLSMRELRFEHFPYTREMSACSDT